MKGKRIVTVLFVMLFAFVMVGCSRDLSASAVEKAARSYGAEEAESEEYAVTELYRMTQASSVYYVAEDSEAAERIFKNAFNRFNNLPNYDITELALVVSNEQDSHNKIRMNFAYVMTLKNEKKAKKMYKYYIEEYIDEDACKSGTKDNYEYTIECNADDSKIIAEGVYLQGNNVFVVRNIYSVDDEAKFSDFFCKKLGIVAPSTIEEK